MLEATEDYLSRLTRVIQPEISIPSKNAFPPISGLPIPEYESLIIDKKIGLLELVDIDFCPITNQIAQRNSQLGKVQVPSERLKYNIELIQRLNICLSSNLTDEETEALQEIKSFKLSQVKLSFMKLLYFEYELTRFHQSSTTTLNLNEHKGQSSTIETLKYFIHLKSQIAQQKLSSVKLTQISYHLEQLALTDYHKKLITSMYKQTNLLFSVNHVLKQFDFEKACYHNSNKPEVKILHKVFNKFYVANIQGYIARLLTEYQSLLTLSENLWQPGTDKTHQLQLNEFFNERKQLHDTLKEQSRLHTLFWQKVLFKVWV